MRHYFFIETEEELTGLDRGNLVLSIDSYLREVSETNYTIKSIGYKVNNPNNTALLVNIGEMI